jgi:hypothetical protein
VFTAPLEEEPTSSGEAGAGMPTKLAPPLVVRTIEVQTALGQGASPSSQNSSGEIAVNETGSKPDGTGPPAGWPLATALGVAPVEVVVLAGAGADVVADVGAGPEVLFGAVVVGDAEVVVLCVEVVLGVEVVLDGEVLVGAAEVIEGALVELGTEVVVGTSVLACADAALWDVGLVPPHAASASARTPRAAAGTPPLALMTLVTLRRPNRFLLVRARAVPRVGREGASWF